MSRRIGGYELDRLLGLAFVTTHGDAVPFCVVSYRPDLPAGPALRIHAIGGLDGRCWLPVDEFSAALDAGAIEEVAL